MAAAGGFILGEQLIQNATPVPRVRAIKEEIKGKIEGLRRATSQWDQFGGILPSRMPFANQSAFGSGRWDSVWASGQYKGVPIDPSIYYQRMHLNMNPQLAYQEEMSKAGVDVAMSGPDREELSNRMIDISDYIYELKDADTILLRKAWLNQNIPLVGPLLGAIQKHVMNLSKTLTGQEGGFHVRIAGIDAPEVATPEFGDNLLGAQPGGEEATEKLRALMEGSPLQQIFGGRATHIKLMPGRTFGRYVGVPMAGGKDIAGELVREGGAIALSVGGQESPYFGQERLAAGYGIGMWQYPEYQGILEARRRGIRPIMSHLQKRTHLGRSLQTAATSSLMAYAANPQMHGVRDQYAQNLYVRGF
jgi:endonuclease YncB( thermonuclease family)